MDLYSPDYWRGHTEAVERVANCWREALEEDVSTIGELYEPLETLYQCTQSLRHAVHDLTMRNRLQAAQINALIRENLAMSEQLGRSSGPLTQEEVAQATLRLGLR